MISANIAVVAVVIVFIFFITILLKFNVVDVNPILRKNVKVKSGNKAYKIYMSDEGGTTMVSKKYHRPDLLYYTNIYPRNPDKLIAVFAGSFLAAGTTMSLAGKTPGETIVSATISGLVATMLLLK